MVKYAAINFCTTMSAKAKVSGSVVAGFPSPAEQYLEPPLDLNELLVKRPRFLDPGTMMAVSWQSD